MKSFVIYYVHMKILFHHFTFLVRELIDFFILLNLDQLQMRIFFLNMEMEMSNVM